MPSRRAVKQPSTARSTAELTVELAAVVARAAFVTAVPVVVGLLDGGAPGICGPAAAAAAVARSVIVQLVGLHSPAEVLLCAVMDGAAAQVWSWLRWLPHTASEHAPLDAPHLCADQASCASLIAALEEIVERRGGAGADSAIPAVPALVLLVDDAAPIERARLVCLAERGPAAGVHVIWVAPGARRLTAACSAFVEVSDDATSGSVGLVADGLTRAPVALEPLPPDIAEEVGRRLAPVVDAGARADDATDLPRSVALLTPGGQGSGDVGAECHRAMDGERFLARSGIAVRPTRQRGAVRPRRAGRRRTLLPRPSPPRPARPGGRHDGSREVGVPAELGAGHGVYVQPPQGDLPIPSTTRVARPSPSA